MTTLVPGVDLGSFNPAGFCTCASAAFTPHQAVQDLLDLSCPYAREICYSHSPDTAHSVPEHGWALVEKHGDIVLATGNNPENLLRTVADLFPGTHVTDLITRHIDGVLHCGAPECNATTAKDCSLYALSYKIVRTEQLALGLAA